MKASELEIGMWIEAKPKGPYNDCIDRLVTAVGNVSYLYQSGVNIDRDEFLGTFAQLENWQPRKNGIKPDTDIYYVWRIKSEAADFWYIYDRYLNKKGQEPSGAKIWGDWENTEKKICENIDPILKDGTNYLETEGE